jgi:PPOX class probable F420-dependent enzyme
MGSDVDSASVGVITGARRALVEACRTATLATVAADGRPRLVPICFVLDETGGMVSTPLDDKPKRGRDPRDLARVRDIRARPLVTLLFEHYSEDWTQLAWVRIGGRADLLEPDAGAVHAAVVGALRAKYPQYRVHDLERSPLIQIAVADVTGWSASLTP